MAKDIFTLAAYAREHYGTPEYDAFLVKTYDEAKEHDILKDYDPQPWWFERLEWLDSDRFNTQHTEYGKEVNVADIVGTDHNFHDENYEGHTWLEMLVALKKKKTPPQNEEKAREAIQPNELLKIILYKFNGKYYMTEGNHRVTYAKFLFNNYNYKLKCKCFS